MKYKAEYIDMKKKEKAMYHKLIECKEPVEKSFQPFPQWIAESEQCSQKSISVRLECQSKV